jgi:16S rRNA (guanine(966)-N(2))-methyltransferase RsmD
VRIISGICKGRRINPPKNLPVRPTTDFAKEGLFNILNNKLDFDEITALDLFAGTGSISLELASRGAHLITSVDLNYKCAEFIRKTAGELKFENIRVIKSNVFSYLESAKGYFDLIFADPPYDLENLEEIPNLVLSKKLLNDGGLFVLEHSRNNNFEEQVSFVEHRKYGNVNFSFFK